MPTPVITARQCLSQEAAAAFDEAVAIAKRRAHSQTTSLHMLSSLLALPTSCLREACVHTRHTAYSAALQFKVLDLTLAVSLDRLPSSQSDKIEDPPVSNSLMAAIKRSQANQRSQPGSLTFNHHHQQQQQYSSVHIVKVELHNLTFSILDDPLVSRVLGEAGFRSYNIKMAALRSCNIFNLPLFSTNFNYYDKRNERGDKGWKSPFMSSFSMDENATRISEVMVRSKKRNPLLLGVSSSDALKAFFETLRGKTDGVFPQGLSGVNVVCIENELLRFMNGDCDDDDNGSLELRLQEVERVLGNGGGQGVLVNLGDFKALSGDGVAIDGLRCLGSKLRTLVRDHGRKLWLIGSAYSYEVYFQVLNKFPSIEEDWDLGILAITSFTLSKGRSLPRSSLMESFVPLGGFFSLPFDATGSLSNICRYASQSQPCDEKGRAEVNSLSCRGLHASDANGHQSSLPSFLLRNTGKEFVSPKANANAILLENAKPALLQKWGSIYEHNYHQPSPCLTDRKGAMRDKSSGYSKSNALLTEAANKDLISIVTADMQQIQYLDALGTGKGDDHTTPISDSSVTTDLCLGIIPSSVTRDLEKPVSESNGDAVRTSSSNCSSQSSSSCCFCDNYMHSNLKESKILYADLVERFAHQESAIKGVIDAITQWQSSCRGIWINLRGPDRLCKKRLGLALADVLYGSQERLISVDLSFQDETLADAILNPLAVNRYDLSMRGTVVDYLVEQLSKHPGIAFLENIDKSDSVVQNTLFKAVKTGRLTTMDGREVNIRHSMFLLTTRFSSTEELTEYSEECILKAKRRSIQLSIGFDLNNKRKTDDQAISRETKRANISLDLNLPAKGSAAHHSKTSWLEDFEKQIDRVVVFKALEL